MVDGITFMDIGEPARLAYLAPNVAQAVLNRFIRITLIWRTARGKDIYAFGGFTAELSRI